MNKIYAIYKGDEFLFMGTRKECASYLNVNLRTITFYTSPTYKKRCKNYGDTIVVIIVEED